MYEQLLNIIKITKQLEPSTIDNNKRYERGVNYFSELRNSYELFFNSLDKRLRDCNKNNPLLLIDEEFMNNYKQLIRFIQYNKKPIYMNSKNLCNLDEAVYILNGLSEEANIASYDDLELSMANILIIAYFNYKMDKYEDDADIEYWSDFNLPWNGFPVFYSNLVNRFNEFLINSDFSLSHAIDSQNNSIHDAWAAFIKPLEAKLVEFFAKEKNKETTVLRTSYSSNVESIHKIESILYELVLYNLLMFHETKYEYVKQITKKLYKIIFIEGADKMGKTSFCDDIKNLEIGWDTRDLKFKLYHFPTKWAYSEFEYLFETNVLGRQLGFAIDTLENLKGIFKEALDNNTIPLIDRAFLSCCVYTFHEVNKIVKKESQMAHRYAWVKFLKILNELYDSFFQAEKELLEFIDAYQFIIVNEEAYNMRIELDKNDQIEKYFDFEDWRAINDIYKQYIDKPEKRDNIPFGNSIKYRKIIYNNNEDVSLEEKRKERIDNFLNILNN